MQHLDNLKTAHIRQKVDFANAERLYPEHTIGLTNAEVEERVNDGYVNFDSAYKSKSASRIIAGHLLTLFNLVNIIIFAALLWVGSFKNLSFMAVIAANICIGVIQEIRAKKAVDRLSFLALRDALVIREGKEVKIPVGEIVLDDVLEYKAGDQIMVDCEVLDGECESNEAFVTGESDTVFKEKGETLLAGSFIASGACRARADKIAGNSYISTISKSAKTIKAAKSVLMTSMKRVITVLSLVIFPLGAFLFLDQLKIHGSEREAVINTSAALIGMIPQGLMLLTSTALAISVLRLSRRKVLVKDLYSVEMLARVDTICLDKTGTLTEGVLTVDRVVEIDSSGYHKTLLPALTLSLGGDNATMTAISKAFPGRETKTVVKKIPFSSKTKWSGIVFDDLTGAFIGAPEYLAAGDEKIIQMARELSKDHRVLLLSASKGGAENGCLPEKLTPAAFVLLSDKIREGAPLLVKYLAAQGVDIKIISGDNPITVSSLSVQVGIAGAEKYLDCSGLKNDRELRKLVGKYTVFGRVTPFQKKIIIQSLKKKKHTVAMTGDGVNDVLALKEADCSIAMGSGTDAARNVAKLVLLKPSFDSLPAVIAEGRRAVNNIQRSASFFLVKTVYATLMAFLFLLLHKPYPFQPIQQSFIAFACIGLPSFVLAFEPNKDRIKGSFFGNVMLRALPGGIAISGAMTLIACLNGIAGSIAKVRFISFLAVSVDPAHIPTISLITTSFLSFLVLAAICYPPNALGKTLMVTVGALSVGGLTVLRGYLELSPLSLKSSLMTLFICALSGGVMFLLTKLSRRLTRETNKKEVAAQ